MDELESIGLGLALGLVLVAALSRYPGEPFDYTTSSSSSTSNGEDQTNDRISSRSDQVHAHVPSPASQVPRNSPAATCAEASTNCCDSSSTSPMLSTVAPAHSSEPSQDNAKAAHRRKIQELQTLLGIESNKMAQLAARADAVGTATSDIARTTTSPFGATATYSARLDMAFYVIVLALLVVVLQSEYGVNVLHLVTHVFPREAETATRIMSVPQQLMQQLLRSRTAT